MDPHSVHHAFGVHSAYPTTSLIILIRANAVHMYGHYGACYAQNWQLDQVAQCNTVFSIIKNVHYFLITIYTV